MIYHCKSRITLCFTVLFFLCITTSAFSSSMSKIKNFDLLWSKFGISPNGKKLAYQLPVYDKYGESSSQIWISNIDGTGKKKIATVPNVPDIGWYDNKYLTISRLDQNNVQIISLDGKQRSISLTDQYRWVTPVLSPNGKWVAFSAVQKKQIQMGIFLLDIKTGAIKTISQDTVKSYVSWSPDSRKLAYGEGSYQQNYKLKIIDIQSGEVIDTGYNGVGVEWSPDGKWIAYTGDIIRGGSWITGVPIDGSIVIMNVDNAKIHIITEPGMNDYDESTGNWEMSGSIWPIWSPDGKKIAYRRLHRINEKDKNTLNEDEIWVVNTDGSGKKKLSDTWSRFAWMPDSKAILIKSENGIKRISINNGKSESLIAWKTPAVPKPMAEEVLTAKGAEARFSGVRPDYAKALLAIAGKAREIYAAYGFDVPAKVTLTINRVENGGPKLWTDGDSQMFLNITSSANLAPPMQSGVFNIFGMCHELGHMAMYRRAKLIGLPEGVGEGWATYAGSVVVDDVYRKLGKNVWPQPYNYAEVEGTARLATFAKDSDSANSPNIRAAMIFYNAQKRYGADKVMLAMKIVLDGKPAGKDVMPGFAEALAKITNDQSARAIVPDEFLTSKIKWNVADREINEKTTEGEIQVADNSGYLLKYDDDTSDGMLSTSGSGHAVMFYAPDGAWAVGSVQIYGSRYGEEQPPKDDFYIFICDQDFNVIKQIEKPYSTFERGDPKWYTLSFEPVKVPRGFYICVYFDPTATKGVYVHYDKSVKKVHSRSALPWTFVSDLPEGSSYDWMIRAHLIKAL